MEAKTTGITDPLFGLVITGDIRIAGIFRFKNWVDMERDLTKAKLVGRVMKYDPNADITRMVKLEVCFKMPSDCVVPDEEQQDIIYDMKLAIKREVFNMLAPVGPDNEEFQKRVVCQLIFETPQLKSDGPWVNQTIELVTSDVLEEEFRVVGNFDRQVPDIVEDGFVSEKSIDLAAKQSIYA